MRKLIGLISFIAILGIVFAVLLAMGDTSEGYRDGYIQTFSHKGHYFNSVWTWEGELALPSFGGRHEQKGGQSSGGVWAFTVDKPSLVAELEAVDAADLVRLHYIELRWSWPWEGDTNYRLTKVEVRRKP